MKEYSDEVLKAVQAVELNILKDFINICEKHSLEYFGIAGTGIGALRHQGFIPWDDDIDIGLPRKDYEKFLKYAKTELKDSYIVMNCEENENYPLMTTRLMKKGTVFREFALKDVKCELGIFLDIYPFDNLSDNKSKARRQMLEAWFFSKLLILRNLPFPVVSAKGWKRKIIHAICLIIHNLLKLLGLSKKKIYQRCKKIGCRYNNIPTKRINYFYDTTPTMNVYYREEIYPLKKMKFEDLMLNFPKDMDRNLTNMYGDYMSLPPKEKRKNHYPYLLEF